MSNIHVFSSGESYEYQIHLVLEHERSFSATVLEEMLSEYMNAGAVRLVAAIKEHYGVEIYEASCNAPHHAFDPIEISYFMPGEILQAINEKRSIEGIELLPESYEFEDEFTQEVESLVKESFPVTLLDFLVAEKGFSVPVLSELRFI